MPKNDNMLAILWMLNSGVKDDCKTNIRKVRNKYKDSLSLY